MNRITSKKYRDASKGQTCLINLSGCTGGGEDTVFCHLRDEFAGGAIKASDISGVDGCHMCHERLDRRMRMETGSLITDEDWYFYAFRGLQRTLQRRIEQGILVMPTDAVETRRTSTAKPKKMPGKPMAKSARKIPSRPMRSK